MSSEVDIRKTDETSAVNSRVEINMRAHTHLKKVEYSLAMYALKLDTNPQRARLIHMADKTVASALDGNPISGEFIGNLLTALDPHADRLARVGLAVTFDTFFEVRPERTDG